MACGAGCTALLVAVLVGVVLGVPPTSRPDLLMAATTQGPEANCSPNPDVCDPATCVAPNCHCSGIESDVADNSQRPQIVYLTYDDAFSAAAETDFYKTLFDGTYTNPDGCPIRATHYLTAQYTDFTLVNKYWQMGHEMASHSITHRSNQDYWKGLNKTGWILEIDGMRRMITQFADIPIEEIIGFRAPFLQIGGNEMFSALVEKNFLYDCSMPSRLYGYVDLGNGLYPYTLDYDTVQDCEIKPCPTCSFPGFWVQPMLDLEDRWFDADPSNPDTGMPCSMLDSCIIMDDPPTSDHVYEMLMKNFNRVYGGNRAPFGLYMHAAWFFGTNVWHYEGYKKFVAEITTKPNVWIVPVREGIEYMRTASGMTNDDLLAMGNDSVFGCKKLESPPYSDHPCGSTIACRFNVTNSDIQNQERYMNICSNTVDGKQQKCPGEYNYPWLGDPCGGNKPCVG